MAVETHLLSVTPMTSPISETTKRCRRTPVSMVVAAKSTAVVARMVALSDSGRPRPFWTMEPPPSTNAATPPFPNAL